MKDYKIIWKINEGNENKILLGDFNITIYKMDRDGGNNTKTLQISFQRSRVYTDIKIASSTKINHLMVSVTDN